MNLLQKKVPSSGEPDFTNVSDDKLKEYLDFVQQMIFVFKYSDKEKVSVLEEIWKQLSIEQSERMSVSVEVSLEREVVKPIAIHKVKTVKRIKR